MDEDTVSSTWVDTIETNLLLRKPDLMGNSKWGFYFNKNIDATITDQEWLDKVHSGKERTFY